MHLQASSENLRILAPASGTIFSVNKNEDETRKIIKGDVVKQGDVLSVIGDMSGLTVHIKVNELTLNQLKIGQAVKVTGIAFSDEILNGEIRRIDQQGEISNGGLPVFSVEVAVPRLTVKQQKEIHVGMSAKVEISLEEKSQITIPITAVMEKDGMSYVKIFDDKKRMFREIPVRTGKTMLDSVIVLSGLKSGDKLVVPD
jgi:multidrug efflux pump subunit AcrA (membrane-fusion protein)